MTRGRRATTRRRLKTLAKRRRASHPENAKKAANTCGGAKITTLVITHRKKILINIQIREGVVIEAEAVIESETKAEIVTVTTRIVAVTRIETKEAVVMRKTTIPAVEIRRSHSHEVTKKRLVRALISTSKCSSSNATWTLICSPTPTSTRRSSLPSVATSTLMKRPRSQNCPARF